MGHWVPVLGSGRAHADATIALDPTVPQQGASPDQSARVHELRRRRRLLPPTRSRAQRSTSTSADRHAPIVPACISGCLDQGIGLDELQQNRLTTIKRVHDGQDPVNLASHGRLPVDVLK